MHGHIGAIAHGQTHIGRSQRGRIVHAIAHHGHDAATFAQLLHLCGFVARQHIGQHLAVFRAQAQAAGHGLGGGLVVARNHHQLQATRTQGGQSLQGADLGFIAKGHEQDTLHAARTPLGQCRQGGALRMQGFHIIGPQIRVHAFLLEPAQTAQQQLTPLNLRLHTAPWHSGQLLRRDGGQALRLCCFEHGTGQWVLAAALHTGRPAQSQSSIHARGWQMRNQARLPHGERAGFVKGHCLHAVRHLQRLGVLDQDAVFGRHTGARHDGHGCGQPQCTGAGDDQHRHGMDERGLKAGAHEHPHRQGQQGHHQHHRHKNLGHLVHQALDGRLGRLRIFHQADDA